MNGNFFKVKVFDDFGQKIATIKDSDLGRMEKKVHSIFGKFR